MDKSQDSSEGEGLEVAAITAALKYTTLVKLTRGIQTRDQVIDEMVAGNVSDDRFELEQIVGDALACLADTDGSSRCLSQLKVPSLRSSARLR